MKLTQTEKAAKLGISQNFLSLIYNGRRLPGWATAWRWEANGLIKKNYMWWRSAKLSQIQRTIDAIK